MSDTANVRRHWVVVPAVPPEKETPIRKQARRLQEEGFDARLSIRQTVTEKAQVRFEARIALDRMMGQRIERVVDRNTACGAERCVCVHDRPAAAIRQNEIVTGNAFA